MFSSNEITLVVLLLLAILLAVFLAAAEASLLRVAPVRARALAASGEASAVRLLGLVDRLPEVLNLILFLALLAQIGAATIAGLIGQELFGNVGVTIASVVLTLVLFIYGEAIPKTYAVRHAERTAMVVAGPVAIAERVLRPLVRVLVWIADIQLPGKGISAAATVTEEELKLLTYEAADEGEITQEDKDLIDRVFRFGDRQVDDVMVPRPDIVAVSDGTPLDEALDIALRSGHRRLPVYGEDLEEVVGIVRMRDLIPARDRGETDLLALALPPLVVPESKRVAGLLTDMQEQNSHMAMVIDEYGVTVGLVTIEDVAEALLGNIADATEATEIEEIGPGRWRVSGSVPVEDLADALDLDLPEGDWNTVAGLVLGVAGELFEPGETVDIGAFRFEVLSVRGLRITEVGIEAQPKVETADQHRSEP